MSAQRAQAGRSGPGAEGHPRQVPAPPLRGRLRRLQSDPHRPGVREGSRPSRQHPSRPLDDGPGRPCQHRGRRRRPSGAEAPLGPVSRHGISRAGDRGHRYGQGSSERHAPWSTRSRPGRNQVIRNAEAELRARDRAECAGLGRAFSAADRAQRTPYASTARGRLLESDAMLSERQQRSSRRRPGLPGEGTAGRVAAIAERGEIDGAPRPCAPSWRVSRRPATSPIRTPRPGACPPTPATAAMSRRCSPGRSPAPRRGEPSSPQVRREIEDAMRETTAALSQITDLFALVSAPPLQPATIHRVEVLRLQPNVVMVVVIASNGGVTKRVFTFDRAVDPGLVEWASSYLNERLAGPRPRRPDGRRAARRPRARPDRGGFIAELAPAFTDLERVRRATPSMSTAPRGFSPRTHSADLPRSTS